MVKWDAEDYHRHSPAQQIWAMELVEKLRLSGDEHVLDIGCGDGKVTAEIALRVRKGSVVGVDNSQEMIRFATESFPWEAFPNLAFLLGDARELGLEGSFDIVFSVIEN